MNNIKFFSRSNLPIEMHKVRIVQKLNLIPIEERKEKLAQAGNNTFLLKNRDVFLDMLTDSGVNAMSDRQQAAMLQADDAYAGSESFERFEAKVKEIFGTPFVLPAHQGRACENIICRTFVKPGSTVPMNYHFTTTKAHINLNGGKVVELLCKEGFELESDFPFKGNIDLEQLETHLKKGNSAFIRMEAGTNLIGGQPFALSNLKAVKKLAEKYGAFLVLDASLLAENLFFVKKKESEYKDKTIRQITAEFAENSDIIYFSARKLGFARGGAICTTNKEFYEKMKELVPLFEGFLTYGGMSVREIEAITVGLDETMDEDVISQSPLFIEHMVCKLKKAGVPVVTPSGGLGCHINAGKFLPHLKSSDYPAGALAAAFYLISGVRGMERGTLSMDRDENGNDVPSDMELLRLALPRRVFTLSQVEYTVDRLTWLYKNAGIIGGLEFFDEPKILRFFLGKLKPVTDWQDKLLTAFKKDFGDSL
ncbi:Tryptophanase [Elusimicrobium minutum Pei191]|uniref:Tryptophanase n=1 Tax=Elusimicrobium minutum (strain Pei191) TaxID=445932 RepID=B2KD89_ELUMP|nr:tryptophanase [Elusimicrobium minutum]ACC98485.1 Tryptophanase [Elusimicrobium minutum Pei191]